MRTESERRNQGRGVSPRLCAGIMLLLAGASYAAELPAPSPAALVTNVADAVLWDFPQPPPFDWGEGVLLTGMMRAHQLTGDPRYLEFVRSFADHWHTRGIKPLLQKQGYCGHWGPGFPMLLLYETTRDRRHVALAEEIISFMLRDAERTRDGGLSHFNGKVQLWVDTLDMCCPVFSQAARLLDRPKLQAEAVRQLEIFARHLQDPATGLFYHMWDESTGQRTNPFWARGNGWVTMSFAEVLKHEPKESAARARLVELFKKQLDGIAPLQDASSGLWHTVLDAPETYLETSASAMFLYAVAECGRLKLIDPPRGLSVRRAWAGLAAKVDDRGRVVGVSGGTRPSTKQGYAAVPTGTYTWGTGAFLLAACALSEAPDLLK